MDILDSLDQAAAALASVAGGMQPDQRTLPTPCTEWNVQQLVNHLIGSMEMLSARAEGREPGKAEPPSEFDAALTQMADSAQATARAWRTPGALERQTGPMNGQTMASITLTEMLVHAWDLAQATGQQPAIDDAIPAGLLAPMHDVLQPQMRGTAFAPETPAPVEANALDRLAAFSGRKVA